MVKARRKVGKLDFFRKNATGFSETRFGRQQLPTRYVIVPANKVVGMTLPKGTQIDRGNAYIPVPLKRNPKKAARKLSAREAMAERKRRSLFGGK